ncbi:MAG: hypothetical protein GX328_02325 [Clostridiaceae bacterium]|nr:hypothetical protein [Clostridiaceae bacterium]
MEIFIAILLTLIITSGGCALFARSYFLRRKKKEDRAVHEMLEHVAQKQNESQMVLASLNLGVIAYSSDGVLLLNNQASGQMIEEIPHYFADFLDKYDVDQKIRSGFLLDKKQVEINYVYNDRSYRLSVQKRELSRDKNPGHIIVIQDITRQVREEQQRKEFVANVSHELKTPLTTIKTYSESLLDWGIDEKTRESIKKDINRLYDGSLRMETLIDDLLLLSRIDGNAIYTRIEKVELLPIVRSCIERLYPEAEKKHIEFLSYTISEKPVAYADRSALERIILNLINNSIKYTQEYGEIKVYVGMLVDEVYFRVTDNGIGIPLVAQENIFKRFYRVDSTGSRAHGGTGLGLAIVKELVDLHLGQIDLKSEIGKGSDFTITLPGVKKTMRTALYELTENGLCTNNVTKAAEADLNLLAKQLGIVAKWKSLQQREVDALFKAIDVSEPIF